MAATLTDRYLAKAADMGTRDGAAGRPAHDRHTVHVLIVSRGALNWYDTEMLHLAYRDAYDRAVRAAALDEQQAQEKSAAFAAAHEALIAFEEATPANGKSDADRYMLAKDMAAALRALLHPADLEPWIEHESGLRFTQAEVDAENKRDRCWRGLAYDPRVEAS